LRFLVIILCLAVAASASLGAEPTARFGAALDASLLTPYLSLGSIIFGPDIALEAGWRLEKYGEGSELWIDAKAGYGPLSGIGAEAGLLWERYPEGKPGTRMGFSLGIRAIPSLVGSGFFHYDPLVFRKLDGKGGGSYLSFLDLALGASIGPDSFQEGSFDGICLKVGVVGASWAWDGAAAARSGAEAWAFATSADPAGPADGKSTRLLLETSLSSLPLMYFTFPLPFTEWGLGVEYADGWYSCSAIARLNSVLVFFDLFEAFRLELYPLRLRLGIWRPGIGVGVCLSDVALMGLSGGSYSLQPWQYIDLMADLCCFDFRTRKGPELRLSLFPLSTYYLAALGSSSFDPPVFHVLRLGYRF
jgi:hypothetical protein